MKKSMLLAVVLLLSGLQVAARDITRLDNGKVSTGRQLSELVYDKLTPDEQGQLIYLAVASGLQSHVLGARAALNKKFKLSDQDWKKLENMQRDFGLESVKADLAARAYGSKAPAAPTKAGKKPAASKAPVLNDNDDVLESIAGLFIEEEQSNIPTPPSPAPDLTTKGRQGKGQQGLTQLPQNIANLIDKQAALDRDINGTDYLKDEDIENVKLVTLNDIDMKKKTTLQVVKELQREIEKLQHEIEQYDLTAGNLKKELADLRKKANVNYGNIDDMFKKDVAEKGYKYALEQIRQQISKEEKPFVEAENL